MEAIGEGVRLSTFTPVRNPEWVRVALGVILCLILVFPGGVVPDALAHQSGCHRWHSCPSDRGTYTCGDLGRCSQCPDNQFCLAGRPRHRKRPIAPSPAPDLQPPTSPPYPEPRR